MNIDNLDTVKRLITETENGQVEFKETTGQLDRGMETLCAFLNGSVPADLQSAGLSIRICNPSLSPPHIHYKRYKSDCKFD